MLTMVAASMIALPAREAAAATLTTRVYPCLGSAEGSLLRTDPSLVLPPGQLEQVKTFAGFVVAERSGPTPTINAFLGPRGSVFQFSWPGRGPINVSVPEAAELPITDRQLMGLGTLVGMVSAQLERTPAGQAPNGPAGELERTHRALDVSEGLVAALRTLQRLRGRVQNTAVDAILSDDFQFVTSSDGLAISDFPIGLAFRRACAVAPTGWAAVRALRTPTLSSMSQLIADDLAAIPFNPVHRPYVAAPAGWTPNDAEDLGFSEVDRAVRIAETNYSAWRAFAGAQIQNWERGNNLLYLLSIATQTASDRLICGSVFDSIKRLAKSQSSSLTIVADVSLRAQTADGTWGVNCGDGYVRVGIGADADAVEAVLNAQPLDSATSSAPPNAKTMTTVKKTVKKATTKKATTKKATTKKR